MEASTEYKHAFKRPMPDGEAPIKVSNLEDGLALVRTMRASDLDTQEPSSILRPSDSEEQLADEGLIEVQASYTPLPADYVPAVKTFQKPPPTNLKPQARRSNWSKCRVPWKCLRRSASPLHRLTLTVLSRSAA